MGDRQRDPEPVQDTQLERDTTNGAGRRRSMLGILVIAVAIGLVVLMVVLHLTGTIGPGSH